MSDVSEQSAAAAATASFDPASDAAMIAVPGSLSNAVVQDNGSVSTGAIVVGGFSQFAARMDRIKLRRNIGRRGQTRGHLISLSAARRNRAWSACLSPFHSLLDRDDIAEAPRACRSPSPAQARIQASRAP